MKHLAHFILLFLTSFSIYGHSPYELVYDIYQRENVWELRIHLTPVAAIEILETYYPSLIEKETVNLKANAAEVTEYFKNHILIDIGTGKNISLKLKSCNLLQHDSEIVFEIEGVPSSQDFWMVEVTALLDVYKRAKNIVKIQVENGFHQAILNQDKVNTTFDVYDNTTIVKASSGEELGNNRILISILFLSGFILFLLVYKKGTFSKQKGTN